MKNFDPQLDPVGDVPSPCTGVCTMHPQTGVCAGCFRTLNEIAQWGTANDQIKRAIWTTILQRRDRSA